MKTTFLVSILSMMLAACATNADDGDEVDVDLAAGKADGTAPINTGTYVFSGTDRQVLPDGKNFGLERDDFSLLVLKDDKTYHRATSLQSNCADGDCNVSHQDGKYRFTTSAGHKFLRFYDASGTQIDKYELTITRDEIAMRNTDTGHVLHVEPSIRYMWCHVRHDCTLQDFGPDSSWACSGASGGPDNGGCISLTATD
jgi:hypothetical protein